MVEVLCGMKLISENATQSQNLGKIGDQRLLTAFKKIFVAVDMIL